ncbi:7TM diverse intracellular signaling domain-containing protein, partial [Mizugakiibacter sediminis]|uniref:7TM diverse intracellular signaling domain-containing protein n=1 Tax=Mizugakiibacter sediminis TaxID=1475481 RepID=UPI00191C6FCC
MLHLRLAWLLPIAWPILLLAAQAQPAALHIERLTLPLPPAEVRADPGTLPWQPVSDVPVRVGEGWLRLTVQGPLPVARPLYLVMPRRGTARVEVYLPNRVEPLVSDDYGPHRADVSTRLHVFEIDRLTVGDRIYVRASGMRVALLQPALMTHDALIADDRVPALLAAALRLLTGIAAAAMLVCAAWRREAVYLAGGVYLLLWLAFHCANDGSLYVLPGTGWLAALRVTGPWLFALAATILLTVFARLLLRLRARAPRLDRLLLALTPLFAAMALAAQLPAVRPWLLPLGNAANALMILDTLALLAAAALAARRGARYATAFLLAWTPVAVSILADALAAMRLLDMSQDIGLYLLAIDAFCGALFAWMAVERATLRGRLLRAPRHGDSAGAEAMEGALRRLCLLAREGVVRRFALLLIHPGEPAAAGRLSREEVRAAVLRHAGALLHGELRADDRYGACGDG